MSGFRQYILTVRRRAEGDYNDAGFFTVTDPDIELTITASVQQVSGSEMLLLPENRRERETLKIFTNTQLYGAEKGKVTNADLVILNGNTYEVVKVFNWNNDVISHYKVYISKRTTNDALLI
tara:strand:- start:619 stop:984 length:366 start_codon:yes stop_codon:yes gene_type:complete